MNIRTRLLQLLLPPLIAFITLISVFFYFNWYKEIMVSFKAHLKSIVISVAQTSSPSDIEWLSKRVHDPDIMEKELFKRIQHNLSLIKDKLPIASLYIVRLDSVNVGDPVLLGQPISETNKAYDGHDKDFAYRQVILVEVGNILNAKSEKLLPGQYDFSESNEHSVYYTKKAFVTPIYEGRTTHQRFMTAYAPVINDKGEVVALVAADVNLFVIDRKLQNAILIIVLSAISTIILVIISVSFIANKISKPVRKLKDAALDIAAGEYEKNIQVDGPQEIVDLANTLNTMSECLHETINQLQENSIAKERLYGEYECSLLLQDHMFDKIVESYHNKHFVLKTLKVSSATVPHGVLLNLKTEANGNTAIILAEAKEKGFQGMYNLLKEVQTSLDEFPQLNLFIDHKNKILTYQNRKTPPPLIWSTKQRRILVSNEGKFNLEVDDLIFLYTQGFVKCFEETKGISQWFSKVLRHFATEGFDLFVTMLTNELNFLTKKKHIDQDIHILCIRIKE